MDMNDRNCLQSDDQDDEMLMEELRRGPWTVEEDLTLINYIALHGEGRWNSLARSAGLKRTGKSCRLRWLNYLRPDVRRGNITLEEQLLILELHSQWGNRWSKIAQYLPGRTDNEIKNYWRTRVQKHAKQLKCDVNSKQFKDTMRYLWMPRLVERIQANSSTSAPMATTATAGVASPGGATMTGSGFENNLDSLGTSHMVLENPSTSASSCESFGAQQVSPMSSEFTDYYCVPMNETLDPDYFYPSEESGGYQLDQSLAGPFDGYYNNSSNNNNYGLDNFQPLKQNSNYQYLDVGDTSGNLWNVEDIWYTNHNM